MPTVSSNSIARSRAVAAAHARGGRSSSSVRCWPTVISGFSEAAGSCGMSPICAAAELASSSDSRASSRSSPWNRIWPLVIRPGARQHPQDGHRGRRLAAAALADQRRASRPGRRENETSLTARTSPRRVKNEALRSRTSRTGPPGPRRSSESLAQGSWRWRRRAAWRSPITTSTDRLRRHAFRIVMTSAPWYSVS